MIKIHPVFYTFKAASCYASEVAVANRACIRLRRDGQLWQVILSRSILIQPKGRTDACVNHEDWQNTQDFDDSFDEEADITVRTERDELLDDLADDVRDYARSEEDGWYYDDPEPVIDTICHPGQGWCYDPGFGGWFYLD